MTKLDIINKALLRVGNRPLQSLDENSADRRLVDALYDSTIEETLRETRVNSTMKRAQLVMLPDRPLFGYNYIYKLPADSIRLIDCYNNLGCKAPYMYWEIEGDTLLTDATQIYCKYVYIPDDVQVLDATTSYAVSLTLAKYLAYPKVQNTKLIEGIVYEYENLILQKVKSVNTLENNPEGEFGEMDWIESRGYNI